MNQIVQFNLPDIMPEQRAVLHHLGIPKGATVQPSVRTLLSDAMELFSANAQPVGLIANISKKEFDRIIVGQGENARDTPLEHIFPRADNLALFALTMNSNVSCKIAKLFKKNDFALATMLDAVASLAAENAVEVFEAYFHVYCEEAIELRASFTKPEISLAGLNNSLPSLEKRIQSDFCVLSYSPGYCGWHISAQEKLFQFLKPETIGISLNDSYLMSPLKSVTGVLVAGQKEIHFFASNYPFCRTCKTYSCHQRMKRLSIPSTAKP